jgi:hypothetical protein
MSDPSNAMEWGEMLNRVKYQNLMPKTLEKFHVPDLGPISLPGVGFV